MKKALSCHTLGILDQVPTQSLRRYLVDVIYWRCAFMSKGWEKQPSFPDPIILPDPVGALEYELYHLEAWGGPTFCTPLSFLSVSHLLQEAIVRGSELSPRPRRLPFSQGYFFREGGSGEQFITNRNWGIDTPASNTDPGEDTSSIYYTQIMIPGDFLQGGGSRGIIFF